MKHTLSLLTSVAIAMSLAPLAATAETVTENRAQTASSVVATAESNVIDFGDSKKKCTYKCVQSTLPEAEITTMFANGNRDLISVNYASVTRRNLDTRKVMDSEPAPDGVEFIKASISQDRDELYLMGNHATEGFSVYRINTSTLEIIDVTPNSPTYTFGYGELTTLPDNNGYLMTVTDNGYKYLCRYSESGVEVGCTTNFSGAAQATSHFHFHYAGFYAFAVGADNKLFTFDIRDMTFTSTTLTGFTIEIGESAYADTFIWIAENQGILDGNVTKLAKISTVSKTVVATYDLPAQTSVMAMNARAYGVTIVGRPFKASGEPEKFSTVYLVDLYPDYVLEKTIKIKNARDSQGLTSINRDADSLYILVAGDGMKTSVIPIDGPDITASAEYHVCPAGWTVTWDFLNLQPGKPLKFYDVYVKKDAPRAKWVKVGAVAAGGQHTYELTNAAVGDEVKVLPRNIKGLGYYAPVLESAPPIPALQQETARQPRC